MSTATRRARKSEEKQERRELLLTSASALFERHGFAGVTMAEIAREAGLAKGTVYLYFKTKEELFLALLDRELDRWSLAMAEALSQRQTWRPAQLAAAAAQALEERHLLRKLLALMGSVLEHNVDYESALAFKEGLARRAWASGALLESVFPFLDQGEGTHLLLRLYGLAIGLQQIAEPAPIMQEVLALPNLADFRISFRTSFEEGARHMLEGMQKRVRVT
jgi:AcrR family transcriptional regulator